MTYAIVETGGKQYRAEKGGELDIELLEAKDGAKVKFDKVLIYSEKGKVLVGKPYVKGAAVEAMVVKHFRDTKVISFKYIRREGNAKTKIGHRQWKTRVKISSLVTS